MSESESGLPNDFRLPPELREALAAGPPLCNRITGRTAAEANLNGAPYGFKATGDAAWDSSSDDWAMFSAAGNLAVGAMVRTARLRCRAEPEDAAETWLAAERRRIGASHPEVTDTMVRETIAYALDEAWQEAYGHHYTGVLSKHEPAEPEG